MVLTTEEIKDYRTVIMDEATLLRGYILEHKARYERLLTDIENELEDKTKVSIHMLNDDCLKKILLYLSPIDLIRNGVFVCKRWFITCTEILFCVCTLKLCDKIIPWSPKENCSFYRMVPNRLYFALNFSQEVVSNLTISGPEVVDKREIEFPDLTHVTLPAISVFCPNLTVLEISRFHLHNLTPCTLPGTVRELTVNCCELLEADLNCILCGLCSLVKLDVSENALITGESIINNLQNNLIRNISVRSCASLDPAVMEFIFSNYKETLEELDASLNQIKLFEMLINSPEPKPIMSVLKSFKVSEKCYNDFLRDARGTVVSTFDMRILPVLQRMPCLEVLYIQTVPYWGFRNVSYVSRADYLDTLAEVLLNLRVLNLTRCPKNPRCLEQFKQLQEVTLDFSFGYICNDRYMALLGGSLVNCTCLQILHIVVESPKLKFHPDSASLIYRLIFDYLTDNVLLVTLTVSVKLIKGDSLGPIKVDREAISRGLRTRNTPLRIVLRNSELQNSDFIDIPSCVSFVFEG